MDRLSHVIIFTGDLAGMQRFYESVGLTARGRSPEWVEFDTAGATLALHAMPDPGRRGVQLRFATTDIDARVRELADHGVKFDPPGIERFPWGRLACLWDPEGNHLTLWEPAEPGASGKGPGLSAVINCRDLAAVKAYYRDALGFATTIDSSWWVAFAVGTGGMGLHPRVDRPGAEGHHGRPITVGFAIPDLADWYEEARARGVEFTAPPTDRGFGTFADGVDPDGNSVTFRDVPEPETLEEQLAEPFEEADAPRRAAIRKPVKKRATAGSRLTLKPVHKARKAATPRRRPAKPVARVASPRGTGPAGTRRKPKRKHDPKRARTKPAIGRLRKAERRTLARKRVAGATAGKTKPVKRASRARTSARPSTRAVARARARR
jgi:predicted enzyme related to lactoylglutathione lyase